MGCGAAGQNILNLLDVDLMRSGSICNGNGSSYTCGLSGADTLRNQIDIVDPQLIGRDMPTGAKQVLGLLGQNRTVRNLDGAVIVDKADGRMPCDNILMLFRESKIIGRNDIFAVQTIGAAGPQLRSNIIKERIAECNGTRLTQILQRIAHGITGLHLSLGRIFQV